MTTKYVSKSALKLTDAEKTQTFENFVGGRSRQDLSETCLGHLGPSLNHPRSWFSLTILFDLRWLQENRVLGLPGNVRKNRQFCFNFKWKPKNSSRLTFLAFLGVPTTHFPFPRTKTQSTWKHPNDLIQKIHQNRSLPSKLVEFYLQKAKIFQVGLKVRSIYSAFISLLLFSLPSADYHKTNLIESRSNATLQIFNQEIFHEFFFAEISVISAMILMLDWFFWLEFGWPGIDCVLADGLQKFKIDWVFGNWFCPEGLKYRRTGLFWTNFMFDLKFCKDGCIYKPANCTDFLMWVPSFE